LSLVVAVAVLLVPRRLSVSPRMVAAVAVLVVMGISVF